MKKVIVFREGILPLSETFIQQQIVALRRWSAVLTGQRFIANGLDLGGLETRLVRTEASGAIDHYRWKWFRRFRWPVPESLRALKDTGASLIHVHFALDAVAAWSWMEPLGMPVVVTLHGYDVQVHPQWWQDGHGGEAMRSYPHELARMAAHPQVSFIAVSQAIRRRAISAYGIAAEKIECLYIGVDESIFTPSSPPAGARAPTILFVGRLVEKKGLDVLLRAMPVVLRQVPGVRLQVVGDGPQRAELEALARSLGVQAEFLGARTSAEVKALLGETRALCFPSVTADNGDAEGFGIVLLEAQASGVPVVTSAVGGRDEGHVDGVTGFGFDERDDVVLADRLARILRDDALATRMGAAARQFVLEQFTLRGCSAALEEHYDALTGHPQ